MPQGTKLLATFIVGMIMGMFLWLTSCISEGPLRDSAERGVIVYLTLLLTFWWFSFIRED